MQPERDAAVQPVQFLHGDHVAMPIVEAGHERLQHAGARTGIQRFQTRDHLAQRRDRFVDAGRRQLIFRQRRHQFVHAQRTPPPRGDEAFLKKGWRVPTASATTNSSAGRPARRSAGNA